MVDVVVDVADGGGDTGNAVVAGRVVVVEGAEMAAAFLLTGVGVVAAAGGPQPPRAGADARRLPGADGRRRGHDRRDRDRQRCAAAAGYRVSGTGFGTAFLGAYRTVVALAYPLTGPG